MRCVFSILLTTLALVIVMPIPACADDAKPGPALLEQRAKAIKRIAELGGNLSPAAPKPNHRVTRIDLTGAEVSADDLALIAEAFADDLRSLVLNDTPIADEALVPLASMRELARVQLKGTSVTGKGIGTLAKAPKLSALDVTDASVRESDLVALKSTGRTWSVTPFTSDTFAAWIVDQPLVETKWSASADELLSIRVLAPKDQKATADHLVVLAELRNDSDEARIVLRPLGDRYRALSSMISIHGPDGRVEYRGPIPGYQLGRSAFAVIEPGQVIRDRIELPVEHMHGLGKPGEHEIILKYSVAEHVAETAGLVFPDRPEPFWSGRLHSAMLELKLGR